VQKSPGIDHIPADVTEAGGGQIFLIPFYLQAVHVHLANGVKLREA
jgi:hypothetical protein